MLGEGWKSAAVSAGLQLGKITEESKGAEQPGAKPEKSFSLQHNASGLQMKRKLKQA